MLSSTISGKRRDRSARDEIEAVAGMHFEAEASRERGALADALATRVGCRGLSPA